MKIYLDNCCLNRPFDDQSNQRIHLESETIKAIFKQCREGYWQLVLSDVSHFEIAKTTDTVRRQKLRVLAALAEYTVKLTPDIQQRASIFEATGIKTFDALHLACAEGHADVFLTVDDRLMKKAQQLQDLGIPVAVPLRWIDEVIQ